MLNTGQRRNLNPEFTSSPVEVCRIKTNNIHHIPNYLKCVLLLQHSAFTVSCNYQIQRHKSNCCTCFCRPLNYKAPPHQPRSFRAIEFQCRKHNNFIKDNGSLFIFILTFRGSKVFVLSSKLLTSRQCKNTVTGYFFLPLVTTLWL